MFSLIHPQNQEMFEDIKGVIRSRKLKMDRQYNGQKKRVNRTSGDLQKHYIEN